MSSKVKRFVILKHTEGEHIHWDLMFESGNTLQTYRLDKAPEDILHQTANATRISDHPLKFLTYQGPVNKGRGHVSSLDAGGYQTLLEERTQVHLALIGKLLDGRFTLTHVKDDTWQFAKKGPF